MINIINKTPIKYPVNFIRLGPVFHNNFIEKNDPIIKNNTIRNEFLSLWAVETK
jgi:hypothetical protein|tara:strand:- start:212 stop:373 length:162 start_codon:yes stop_codon:yes gene_type:complete